MNTISNIECEVDKYLQTIKGASILKLNGGTIVELKELDKVIGYDLTEYDEFGEIPVFSVKGVKELGFEGTMNHIQGDKYYANDADEVINSLKLALQE